MGIWGEIKYAINSTLGTRDFKPLNEIIMQTKDLAASNTLYKIVFPTSHSQDLSRNKDNVLFKFKANRNGSIRLFMSFYRGLTPRGITIRAFINTTMTNSQHYDIPADLETECIFDVNISKGNIYTITGNPDDILTFRGAYIGAIELDITGIDIIEEV